MTLGVSVAEIVENSKNPLLAIHPSWERVLLGDVADILNGFAFDSAKFSKDSGFPLLRIRDIGETKTDAFYTGDFDKAYVVKAGDLLIGMDGDFNSARWAGENALLNQRVCKVTLKTADYHPKFLEYALPGYLKAINDHTSAVTVKHLSSRTVAEIPLPYPPLPEQERIVAKIEELFTQLEAGAAALKRVQAGLKRYKASVLKAAVEGRLFVGADGVRPMMETGVRPLSEEASPAQAGRTPYGDDAPSARTEGELPDGWRWITVAELAANEPYSITDGPFGSKLKTEHYTDAGPRVIRLQNIGDGEFQDAKAHISQSHFETLKRHRIYAGDLVIAGLGESLPRACVIPDYVGDAIVKADCIRFKPNPQIADTKYLLFALNSETVKKMVVKVVHGIGRPRMNQQEIKAIPIPLPPLAEQRRIVAEVERRLSVVKEVEAVVAASVARASRLRQSVLKSAFEGRLVP